MLHVLHDLNLSRGCSKQMHPLHRSFWYLGGLLTRQPCCISLRTKRGALVGWFCLPFLNVRHAIWAIRARSSRLSRPSLPFRSSRPSVLPVILCGLAASIDISVAISGPSLSLFILRLPAISHYGEAVIRVCQAPKDARPGS